MDTLINREAEPKSVGVEWTQPVREVCTIIVVEHSAAENFEMEPSNEKGCQLN